MWKLRMTPPTDICSLQRKGSAMTSENCLMDFGKLPSVDQVDFSLPAEPAQNAEVLAQMQPGAHPALYIGPTGYNMKPWVGKWYPLSAKEPSFLRHYGAQFNTIEHNTTHYRIPEWSTVQRWHDETPDDFRFCPKIPQTISHSLDLGLSKDETRIFCEAITLLGEKLGCCFIQLPPGFAPRNLKVLERFLEAFPRAVPLAVEVRHPLFFKDTGDTAAFFQLLEAYKTASVITDVSGRRDVCHMRLTTEKVLIRFVGNGLHPSDYTRVRAWAGRLLDWFAAGLHEAYFFTHEPDNLLAPELTAFCVEVFKELMPHVAMRGPKEVAGQQGLLF